MEPNTFKIQLNADWFKRGGILCCESGNYTVVSGPKPEGLNWWRIILYYLSFKTFYRSRIISWSYKLKPHE